MKKYFLVAFVLLLASFVVAQRLPETAVPENYKLTFAPNFEKNNFAGEEAIKIRLLKPTSQIVLNAAEIEISKASVVSGGGRQIASVSFDKEKETATFTVAKELQPGPITLEINYVGILNDQLRGFYLGKDDQGHKYAVTQFEATDARRAFPSFDEPAYKATFDITVIADQGMTAISNTKMISDAPGPGEKHTVRFATSQKMSSYLAAIAVGNFDYIEGEAEGIPIRVYSMPGKKQLGAFALQVTQASLAYYNRYFGIKYPYGKLDLIALPDFSAGAMENVGCITFREAYLLTDEKEGAIDLKKTIASVTSHEIAHMWFGDLVTMKWWDDIWLNEGFATWMENKPVAKWKPEWNYDLDDVSGTGGTLNVDSLANTRPIHQAAETPAQIQELFDGIAYGKAASVLRMLESYLGEETFRAGVNAYLQEHQYGNSTASDFWDTLAKTSHKPVDKIMPTWVKQPGAPIVNVKAQCSGNSTSVSLSQQRYFFDPAKFEATNDQLWQIPLCLKGSASGTTKCEVMTRKEESFTLPGCSTWVLANAGAAGYFRTGYQRDALRALATDAETKLTPAERIGLESDIWGLMRVGRASVGDYLIFAQGLQSERHSAVVEAVLRDLNFIGQYLANDSDRVAYHEWLRQYLAPTMKEVGWEAKPGESDEQRTLRSHLIGALGYDARDPQALAQARKVADRALADPMSVDRELAGDAFELAALNGDAEFYDKLIDGLKNPRTPEEYYIYFNTLPQFSDPKLLQRTLDLAVSPEVRSQDALGLITRVLENPAGENLAWDFIQTHWDAIIKSGGPFASGEVVGATRVFCDTGKLEQVRQFFSTHKIDGGERTYKQSMERIKSCVDLKSQQEPQLATWLGQHGSSGGK